MNIKSFLLLILGIFVCMAAVNVPLNFAFEELKGRGYIREISADGFKSWNLFLNPEHAEKKSPPSQDLPGEWLPLDEIKAKKNVVVFLGSSVVAGDGVQPEERFTSELNKNSDTYFMNAGYSGSEVYSYLEKIRPILAGLENLRCVIWLPNRNDLISQEQYQAILSAKSEATALSAGDGMPILDRLFFGFFKRLAQRFTYEGNLLKERSLASEHQLYYTKGLLSPLPPETLIDVAKAIFPFERELRKRNVSFSAMFLPSRHFNHFYTWDSAKAFHSLENALLELGIPYHQLFSEIKGTDNYYDYVHFNPRGHRQVAELLRERLPKLCP